MFKRLSVGIISLAFSGYAAADINVGVGISKSFEDDVNEDALLLKASLNTENRLFGNIEYYEISDSYEQYTVSIGKSFELGDDLAIGAGLGTRLIDTEIDDETEVGLAFVAEYTAIYFEGFFSESIQDSRFGFRADLESLVLDLGWRNNRVDIEDSMRFDVSGPELQTSYSF